MMSIRLGMTIIAFGVVAVVFWQHHAGAKLHKVEFVKNAVVLPSNTPAGCNVTVEQDGVTLTFSNVTRAGETTATPIDPNSLQGVPDEYVINANSLAFEITTTAAYSGPINLGFKVPGINDPIRFSAVRVLHGEPPPVPNFVDRTVLAPDTPAPDFNRRTVHARVTSLSPFVITETNTPTGAR